MYSLEHMLTRPGSYIAFINKEFGFNSFIAQAIYAAQQFDAPITISYRSSNGFLLLHLDTPNLSFPENLPATNLFDPSHPNRTQVFWVYMRPLVWFSDMGWLTFHIPGCSYHYSIVNRESKDFFMVPNDTNSSYLQAYLHPISSIFANQVIDLVVIRQHFKLHNSTGLLKKIKLKKLT